MDALSTDPTDRTDEIRQELDLARTRGPLRQLVIPPCPRLLAQLQQAMAPREPDLTEVARIAASDVAMAATLIRQSNGAAFAAMQAATTVGQALTRLGLDRSAQVMTTFLAARAVRVDSPHLRRFWERAAKSAQAMTFLARALPGVSHDVAHTYGLFCHVGLPVLLQSVRGYGGTLVEARARIDRSMIATENANHKTDHAVVGALVARVWGLAPVVMAAIRLHHDPQVLQESRGEPEVHTLVAMGLVADALMCRHEGLPEEPDWATHGGAALRWLGADERDLTLWEDGLRDTLDAI